MGGSHSAWVIQECSLLPLLVPPCGEWCPWPCCRGIIRPVPAWHASNCETGSAVICQWASTSHAYTVMSLVPYPLSSWSWCQRIGGIYRSLSNSMVKLMAPHHGAGKGWILFPFFDVNLMRKEESTWDVTAYRKPTHTDRYLHFHFHHLIHVKRGLV